MSSAKPSVMLLCSAKFTISHGGLVIVVSHLVSMQAIEQLGLRNTKDHDGT